jgi:dye decolorizing peroxidase
MNPSLPPQPARSAAQEWCRFSAPIRPGSIPHPEAHATFVSLDLLESTDRAALSRMMRILSDDAARLTQGRAALADSEPELALVLVLAHRTMTFGFGPRFVERAQTTSPPW